MVLKFEGRDCGKLEFEQVAAPGQVQHRGLGGCAGKPLRAP